MDITVVRRQCQIDINAPALADILSLARDKTGESWHGILQHGPVCNV
jgi:hypothetical protein